MDTIALVALLVCAILNRPSRQSITLVVLAVFTLHYLFAEWMLDSDAVYSVLSVYGHYWQWPYFVTAALFDAVLFVILLGFFPRSSLRKDIFIIILGIISVDFMGFCAYILDYAGEYYAGAMLILNTILIIRLMILTKRDRDGLHNYRLSDLVFRLSHSASYDADKKGSA